METSPTQATVYLSVHLAFWSFPRDCFWTLWWIRRLKSKHRNDGWMHGISRQLHESRKSYFVTDKQDIEPGDFRELCCGLLKRWVQKWLELRLPTRLLQNTHTRARTHTHNFYTRVPRGHVSDCKRINVIYLSFISAKGKIYSRFDDNLKYGYQKDGI